MEIPLSKRRKEKGEEHLLKIKSFFTDYEKISYNKLKSNNRLTALYH
jgi:hypothetical protein